MHEGSDAQTCRFNVSASRKPSRIHMRREVVTESSHYQYNVQRAKIPCGSRKHTCFVDSGSLVGIIDEVPSVAVVPKGIMATTTDHLVGGVFDLGTSPNGGESMCMLAENGSR